ncbi:MAG: HsdR family type I site-specific deoxyribonuclease [Ignavibacterium sp.]|nr:HsdR family type I site-specific deoxyribonuclease [Ignavibacterium sp.]
METNSIGSERKSVQEPIIKYVSTTSDCENTLSKNINLKLGYEYLTKEKALQLRNGKSGIILIDIFIPQLLKLNPKLTEIEAREILKQLEKARPDIEGNFTIWQFLKGIKTIYIQSEKRDINVKLVDFENINDNIFQVTDEFEFSNGFQTIRQDVVFFINGIPVVFVETKSPSEIEGMSKAFEQLKRYHNECPELLAVEQVFVMTHIIKFLYGATWNVSEKNLYNWKEKQVADFENLVKSFFDKKRIVKLITDYILYTRKDDLLQKVILRPHQIRAVEKIVERAKEKKKKRGLIWHTQGSGKTYTMILAAKKIIENPLFENPTVIMLVDRNELEAQLFGNLQSVGFEYVELVQSKAHLEKILREDRRGLIVSMIHKFDGISENICRRDNVFILVDEAHRTTSGKLGNYLMGALPNATYIGFTGTPIDKSQYGQGTFLIFGKDDPPKGYLDKYSIAESIEDGTTVKLHYTLAPNELRINKELLEKEFLDLKEAEGMSDVEELNMVLEKAVNLKIAIKSPNRINEVAEFIAKHFRENVEPLGYKAFVVAIDREACSVYKKELDKHLPEDYSRIVYSSNYNDSEEMQKYHLSEEEEKRIRKSFLEPQKNPKILIVTNKLLTGFDAPILYCMYLDKPMRDHILLQTIARVNRPYEDEEGKKKPSGLVVDFIGIFSNLEKALAFDSSDIENIIDDIEKLKDRFKELIEFSENNYLKPLEKVDNDKKIEFIIVSFEDENKRKEFYSHYRDIIDIFNIISPDEFLRPYLEIIEALTKIYKILKEAFEFNIKVSKEFTKKVEELVKKNVHQSKIQNGLEIVEIDENTLTEIEKKNSQERSKVFNFGISIISHITKEKDRIPFLKSIGEKVEEILTSFRDRQISSKQALEEIKKLYNEIIEIQKTLIEKELNVDALTIYYILKKENIQELDQLVEKFKGLFDKYPHWKTSEEQQRYFKREAITLLRNLVKIEKAVEITNKIVTYK